MVPEILIIRRPDSPFGQAGRGPILMPAGIEHPVKHLNPAKRGVVTARYFDIPTEAMNPTP